MRALSAPVKRFVPFVTSLLLSWGGLHAATLVQLSLTDMIGQSTSIEHAKVINSWAAASGQIIYTHYKLQISEQFKGPAVTEIMVFGGSANGKVQNFPGAPQLNAGDDFVFFLYTNKAGFNYVVGLTQGLFHIAQDGSTDPGVTRSASQERMLDSKTGRQVKDQTLTMKLSDLRSQILTTLGKAGQ
jgi:hypothetical protein